MPRTVRRAAFIDPVDRATLEAWVRARTTSQRTVLRSRIVLLLDDGLSAREVARRIGVSRHTVDLWKKRYLEEGCETVTRDRPGRGRRPAAATRDRAHSRNDEEGRADICLRRATLLSAPLNTGSMPAGINLATSAGTTSSASERDTEFIEMARGQAVS